MCGAGLEVNDGISRDEKLRNQFAVMIEVYVGDVLDKATTLVTLMVDMKFESPLGIAYKVMRA